MAKRVYLWTGTAAIGTIIGLLFYLQTLGLVITSDDVVACDGNICESVITIRNPTGNDVDIYNKLQVQLDFTPKVKWHEFMVEDGSCKLRKDGSLSVSSTGIACGKAGWRWLNFTDETKPVKDRIYVWRFAKYSTKKYLLRGEKESLFDKVKWGMNIGNDSIDPVWITANHSAGKNITGISAYFEEKNVLRMNVTKYVLDGSEPLDFSVTNLFPDEKVVTCGVQVDELKVRSWKMQVGTKITLQEVYNLSLKKKIWLNGTTEDVLSKVNASNISITMPVYENVPVKMQEYDGRNWLVSDFGVNSGKINKTEIVLRPIQNFRDTNVKYSYLCNASNYYVDFEPVYTDNNSLPTSTRLVNWYQFENALNDTGLGKNNLSIAGGTGYTANNLNSGFLNKGVYFDADDESLDQQSNVFFTGQSNRTTWAWVNTSDGALSHWMSGGTSASTGTSWEGQINTQFKAETWSQAIGSVTPQTNRWYFFVMTANSTHWCLYLNGTLDACSTASISTGTNPVRLGARLFAANQDWNGFVDEVAFWNVSLNASQIIAAYESYVDGDDPLNLTPAPPPDVGAEPLGNPKILFPLSGITSNLSFLNYTNVSKNLTRNLYISGKGFVTNNTGNFSSLFLPVSMATYEINLSECNATNCGSNVTIRQFTHDNVTPNIDFDATTPANETSSTTNSVFVNITTFEEIPVNDSVVGFWKFDYNANDSGIYGNRGTIIGAVSNNSQNCIINDCFSFDGVNDYVDVGTITNWTQLTVSAWIYRLPASDSTTGLVAAGVLSFPGERKWEFYISNSGADATIGKLKWAGGNAFGTQAGNSLIQNNTWTHVAVTVDNTSTTNNIKFYINGVLDATRSMTDVVGEVGLSRSTVIGSLRRIEAGNSFFNGSIDEVQMWNRVLNDNEINDSFNRGRKLLRGESSAFINFDNSLVGYWRFEEGSGTSASDFSTYSGTGTLNSFACTNLDCNSGSGWVSSGKRGKSLAVDGINDYVSIGSFPNVNYSRNFTIEAWLYPRQLYNPASNCMGTSPSWIISQFGDVFHGVRIITQNTTGIGFSMRSISTATVSTGNSIPLNQWYHIVGIGDGSAKKISLYVNGVFNGSASVSGYDMNNASKGNLNVGWDQWSCANAYFNGSIDEVKIWNRALNTQEVNVSYNAGRYRLENNFTGLSLGSHNYTAYVVDSAGNLNQTGMRFYNVLSTPTLNLTLNGLAINRTYEYGTTATLNASINGSVSSRTVCLQIYASGYALNYSCQTGNASINVTWNLLRETTFDSGDLTKNFSGNSNFTIVLDNRTFLQNVSFNVSGVGDNISFYVINSSKVEVLLAGRLNGTVLLQKLFLFQNKQYEILNLTFISSGIQTIFANFSTFEILRTINASDLRINVSGFAIDAGNELDLSDNFSESTYINFTNIVNASVNLSVWEDFVVNKTILSPNRFASTGSCAIDEYRQGTGGYSLDTFPDLNLTQLRCVAPIAQTLIYYVKEFDVRNFSRFDIHFYGATSGAAGTGRLEAGFYDGNSFQDVFARESHSCAPPCGTATTSDHINLSFRKVTNSLTNWNIYVNDVLDHTESFTLLQGSSWRFGFKLNQDAAGAASAVVNIHTIMLNAIMPVKSKDGLRYNNTISVTSIPVDTTINNITAAYCDWIDASVENYGQINTTCELSGNNGRNWVVAPLGERVLLNSNSTLLWRINCSMASFNDSCVVPQVRTRIISGSVSNLSFDFGSDGVSDYRIGGFFNQTNSSILVINNSNRLYEYARSNCANQVTCKVPISISTSSGGIVQINNFNLSRDVGRLFFNASILDNLSNMKFFINFSEGNVTVNDVNVDYRGTKSFGVASVFGGDSAFISGNVSFNVTIKYSPFNISLPIGVNFYEVFPANRNSLNVTPRGQNNLTPIWNITNLAYDTGINVSVGVNETYGNLYNITWSRNWTKTSNFRLLNTSQFLTNISLDNAASIWAWHDFNITRRFIIDYFTFSSICNDCFPTFDRFNTNILVTD